MTELAGPPKWKQYVFKLSTIGLTMAFSLFIAAAVFVSTRPQTIRVALDAGHGGEDTGAVGIIAETELTEQTTGYLFEFLKEDKNYTPILCRQNGKSLGINARCKKAERKGAQLLLSIHGNSDTSETSTGFECYPAPPGRKYHEDSLRFAFLLSQKIAETGIRIRGTQGIRFAYYIPGADGMDHKKIVEAADTSLTGYPSFGIVEYPGCPAVLAEQCFVTNPEDIALLGDEKGCRLAAAKYYSAICSYFQTVPIFDENGSPLPAKE